MTKSSKRTDQVNARLDIRLPIHIKDRLEQAAVISGVSLIDFIIVNLAESADKVLEHRKFRKLSDLDREIFSAMLEADDNPNEKLKDAFKARQELIAE